LGAIRVTTLRATDPSVSIVIQPGKPEVSTTGFAGLVTAIVASDLAEPITRHIDADPLPSREAVISSKVFVTLGHPPVQPPFLKRVATC
jgi:hypothetical protein